MHDNLRNLGLDALDRTVVNSAVAVDPSEMGALVGHLRESGLLTSGLILRALLSGNLELVATALSQLSGLPTRRIVALLQGSGAGLEALLRQSGMPATVYPAFVAALTARDELGAMSSAGGRARLRRRTCERVLSACQDDAQADDSLLVLLRRFTTESRREEARLFCDELAEFHQAWQANERIAA